MDLPISTQQAAKLLGVHESSVRRWCDGGRLDCERTPGGHRRIPLQGLLAFASEEGLPCRLLGLRPYESRVWEAVRDPGHVGYDVLVSLAYGWLVEQRADLYAALLDFLVGLQVAMSSLFDRLIATLAARVGQAWHEGELAVGDEHRVTEMVRDSLYALLLAGRPATAEAGANRPVAIVGCARTDGHELGALMVRILLERAGWEVIYLGGQVPAEDFAMQRSRHRAVLVCVSLGGPGALADALQLVRVLESMYEAPPAFRLVLGGALHEQLERGGAGLSSVKFNVHLCRDLRAFVRFLEHVRLKEGSPPAQGQARSMKP